MANVYSKKEFKEKIIPNLKDKLEKAEEFGMKDKVKDLKNYIRTCEKLLINSKHGVIHVIGTKLLVLINEDTKNWKHVSTEDNNKED